MHVHACSHFWSHPQTQVSFSIYMILSVLKYESEVTQLCPTLCDPMDCSIPGSSVHGIFQARILEWVAISFFRGSSWPRDWTWVSHVAGRCFTIWATGEALIFKQRVDGKWQWMYQGSLIKWFLNRRLEQNLWSAEKEHPKQRAHHCKSTTSPSVTAQHTVGFLL